MEYMQPRLIKNSQSNVDHKKRIDYKPWIKYDNMHAMKNTYAFYMNVNKCMEIECMYSCALAYIHTYLCVNRYASANNYICMDGTNPHFASTQIIKENMTRTTYYLNSFILNAFFIKHIRFH